MHSLDFEYEEPIEKRFEDLCHDLCIEESIREEAWDKYKDVWANFSIDGDQIQWLVCSLYECCRRSISDSLGGHVVENAYVSLSRLLSTAKMSMVQFFHRIRKWADMTDMVDDMRDRVELLERQFAVSSVIFRNFGRSFGVLFHESDVRDGPEHPTSTDLFRLTWLLFIKSRAGFPAVTDDLVNSYHLLACCLDWILGAVMVSRRTDLIRLELNGLPKEFLTVVSQKKTWSPPHELPPCMLRTICEYNEVNYVECKTVKEHFFKPFMVRLIEKDLIKLDPQLLYGSIMESENFEITLQNLNNNYEEYIIGTGDFDERIYLTPNAAEEIGSAGQIGVHSNLALSSDLAPSAQRYMLEVSNTGFGGFTETNRRGRTNAGAVNRLNGGIGFNNPEARNQNLNQLQILLAGHNKEPSAALVDLIQSHCSVSPLADMQSNLDDLGMEFQMAYVRRDALNSAGTPTAATTTRNSSSDEDLAMSAAQQRVQLGYQLYYLTLENILVDEVRRMEKRLNAAAVTGSMDVQQPRRVKPDLSGLLTQELFHRALFSCCMELVLISCDPSDHHFPWILEALNLDAFHLFKVIEVVVRNLNLPRDIVKYMNQVAELILDSYAWRSQSPLWSIIKASGHAPSIEDAIPPEKLEQPGLTRSTSLTPDSRKGVGLVGSSSNLTIRHSGPSPAKQARLLTSSGTGSLIRARTGSDNMSTVAIGRHSAHLGEDESAQATAQLLASRVSAIDSDADTGLLAGPATDQVVNMNDAGAISSSIVKRDTSRSLSSAGFIKFYPARRDSLAIFFRQLYVIASVRLRDLCDRLSSIVQQQHDILTKTWTCVEHVIVHETELLRDRCLDQILLCSLYGVCKVTLYRPLTFVDIIQVYRMQPQSNRDIYRRVLISHVAYGRNRSEDRADLSRFYNLVFVPRMSDFLRRLVSSNSYNHTDASGRGLTLATGGTAPPDSLWADQSITMAPMPAYPTSQISSSVSGTVLGNVLSATGSTGGSTEVSQARRLASNRNVFISPVKQQQPINLSPKRVVFTIGRSSGKDLQDVNLMISSAERRASMTNLTMNLKRPGGGGGSGSSSGFVTSSGTFAMSPSSSGARSLTVVGPSTFAGKRIDFDM